MKPSRIGRETDRKNTSVFPSLIPDSSSSKCNLAPMTELDEPNSPVEPERSHREFNLSQQPTHLLRPPISPSPLASSPGHDLAPIAVEQAQTRVSAEYLLMLASGVGQAAELLVTQVGTPGRTRSPSDLRPGDLLANMTVPDAGQETEPASPLVRGVVDTLR